MPVTYSGIEGTILQCNSINSAGGENGAAEVEVERQVVATVEVARRSRGTRRGNSFSTDAGVWREQQRRVLDIDHDNNNGITFLSRK